MCIFTENAEEYGYLYNVIEIRHGEMLDDLIAIPTPEFGVKTTIEALQRSLEETVEMMQPVKLAQQQREGEHVNSAHRGSAVTSIYVNGESNDNTYPLLFPTIATKGSYVSQN